MSYVTLRLGEQGRRTPYRIVAVLTVMNDPAASTVTEDAMRRAAVLMWFYLGEALHLSGVQPQHEQAELAIMLWTWLPQRGKRYITLAEMTQYGPRKLRKAQTLRMLMNVLIEHYWVRPAPEGLVAYNGKKSGEAGKCACDLPPPHPRPYR